MKMLKVWDNNDIFPENKIIYFGRCAVGYFLQAYNITVVPRPTLSLCSQKR